MSWARRRAHAGETATAVSPARAQAARSLTAPAALGQLASTLQRRGLLDASCPTALRSGSCFISFPSIPAVHRFLPVLTATTRWRAYVSVREADDGSVAARALVQFPATRLHAVLDHARRALG
jgi:hypothetical protein